MTIKDKAQDIEEKIEAVEDKINEINPETRKEARERQPWMPIGGSIIAGIILLVLVGLFMGWF